MATKRELRAKAVDLAAKLGTALAVDFDRLNHAALVQLVSDLEAKAESTGDASSSSDALPVVAVDSDVTVVTHDVGETWSELAPSAETPPDAEPPPEPPVVQEAPKVRVARAVPPKSPEELTIVEDAPRTQRSRLVSTREYLRASAARAPYVVAEGRTITTRRGTIGAGGGVREKDVEREVLDLLVKDGTLIKRDGHGAA